MQYLREGYGKRSLHIVRCLDLLRTRDHEVAIRVLGRLVGPVLPTFRPSSLQTFGRHDDAVHALFPHLDIGQAPIVIRDEQMRHISGNVRQKSKWYIRHKTYYEVQYSILWLSCNHYIY